MAARQRSTPTDKHVWNLGDLTLKGKLTSHGTVESSNPQVASASLVGLAFDVIERRWAVSANPPALYLALAGNHATSVLTGIASNARFVAIASHAHSQSLYVVEGHEPHVLKVAATTNPQAAGALEGWRLAESSFASGAIAIDGSSRYSPTGVAYVVATGRRTLHRLRLTSGAVAEALPFDGPDSLHISTITIDEVRRTLLIVDGRRWRTYEIDIDTVRDRIPLRSASVFDFVPPSDLPANAEISDLRIYRYRDFIKPRILSEESRRRLKDLKARMLVFAVPAARRVFRVLQASDRFDPMAAPFTGNGIGAPPSRTADPNDLLQLSIGSPTRLALSFAGKLGILTSENGIWVLTPASNNIVHSSSGKHDT